MIQRIQTVYLLVVAILAVVMISLPVGSFVMPDYHMSELTNLALVSEEGVSDYAPWALFALQTVSAILALVTIFLYKKRMLQIRLTLFNMLVLVGYYVTLVIFVLNLKGDASFVPSWTVCLPLISIILSWLAIRAIGKDEMLVKAYERLR
mgnify:FL=1